MSIRLIICLLALSADIGSASDETQDRSAPPRNDVAGAGSTLRAGPAESESAGEIVGSELSGTEWRLIKIMSMDDTVYVPDDPLRYSLKLNTNGSASIMADCNRGSGSWTSKSASQLQFDLISATQALCPENSLSEKYLAQFKWVRSYVMKDGNLFLATMADGSIIEFEPASGDPLVATLLGKEIRTVDSSEMQDRILEGLFDRYAAEQGIEVELAEIDSYVQNMRRGMESLGLSSGEKLTPEEAAEVESVRRQMGHSLIRQWKINKALYRQYGGRIIYQQLGPEPLDAYRRFLEEQQREGAFKIHEQAFASKFWRYFTDDSIHDFVKPGSKDEAQAFATPPWESDT